VTDDGELRVVSERDDLLVDHKSEDTHHGGTAVVELDGTLGELGLLIEGVPSEVDVSITEVTNELVSGSGNILHEGALEDTDEGNDLHNSSGGDVVRAEDSGNTVGEAVEGLSVAEVSRKVDSGTGDDLAKEGKHTNTSMLDLDVTKTVETVLVLSGELAEGVEEAKRRLSSEFIFESLQGRSLGGSLGRGKGGGGGDKGGDNGSLHLDQVAIENCGEGGSCM